MAKPIYRVVSGCGALHCGFVALARLDELKASQFAHVWGRACS